MPLIAKFAALYPLLVYLAITVIFLGFGIITVLITRGFTDFQTRSAQLYISSHVFATAGALFAVLLAFITIIVWGQYNKAAENAAKEADVALAMYRDLSLYYDWEQAAKTEQSLLVFIHSVIEDEYPAMAKMQRSQPTAQAIDHLWADVRKLKVEDLRQQALFNEILRDMNNIAELRASRLGIAENYELLGGMKIILGFGAVIVIILAVLFGPEKLKWHITLTSLLAILIATALFVLTEYEFPFEGGLAIQPNAYMNVLEIIHKK